MIRLRGLNKIYQLAKSNITALDQVELDIKRGEIFGVIGYSGAGKSTLLRAINLLERPTTGDVSVDGKSLLKLSSKQLRQSRRQIGMIFQHFNLLWSRTVRDNIAFPLEVAGESRKKIQSRVEELAALVGLTERLDVYPSQLSGGQKQRVGIARALANDPKVLLADEATSALDPKTTDSILELLLDINRKLGITIVLITHEMHVIHKICDRVAVMNDGRIVELDTVEEIFREPKQDITREFISQLEVRERGGEGRTDILTDVLPKQHQQVKAGDRRWMS
jgi:D-methionine transport system ATP-binding protein